MFKPFGAILRADPRHQVEVMVGPDNHVRAFTLADHYQAIAGITLHDGVPTTTRDRFDDARNVFVYSWFAYELATTAEIHALTIVESAIREKVLQETADQGARDKIQNMGLGALLNVAKGRKIITYSDFGMPAAHSGGPRLNKLDYLVMIRNELAHGAWHLLPSLSVVVLDSCAELLNRLWQPATGEGQHMADSPE